MYIYIYSYWSSKVGICNFSPHLRNFAILRTTKSIAELRTKKSCGSAIADLQNLTSAIPQLSAISSQFPYFIVPFPRLRMLKKSTRNNVGIQSSLSMEIKKIALKGQQHEMFGMQFFFQESTPYGFLIHTLKLGYCDLKPNWKIFYSMTQEVHMGWFTKKQRPKILCYCPFKIISKTKKTWW
jgi:hypothetical protein